MNPHEAAKEVRRRARELRVGLARVRDESVTDALETARRLSSGNFSPQELRRAGSPFARRAPQGAFTPEQINKRSGEFLAGWQERSTDHPLSGVVENETPQAAFLGEGTTTMEPRPIAEAVEVEITPRVLARVVRVLKRTLKG